MLTWLLCLKYQYQSCFLHDSILYIHKILNGRGTQELSGLNQNILPSRKRKCLMQATQKLKFPSNLCRTQNVHMAFKGKEKKQNMMLSLHMETYSTEVPSRCIKIKMLGYQQETHFDRSKPSNHIKMSGIVLAFTLTLPRVLKEIRNMESAGKSWGLCHSLHSFSFYQPWKHWVFACYNMKSCLPCPYTCTVCLCCVAHADMGTIFFWGGSCSLHTVIVVVVRS